MTAHADNGAIDRKDSVRTLAAALLDGDRDRDVARSTRRVVMASAGVMRDRQAVQKRTRSVVLAALLLLLLVIGPLAWLAVDYFGTGGHLGDLTGQFTLWACIVCPALLSAALVAGWLRKR